MSLTLTQIEQPNEGYLSERLLTAFFRLAFDKPIIALRTTEILPRNGSRNWIYLKEKGGGELYLAPLYANVCGRFGRDLAQNIQKGLSKIPYNIAEFQIGDPPKQIPDSKQCFRFWQVAKNRAFHYLGDVFATCTKGASFERLERMCEDVGASIFSRKRISLELALSLSEEHWAALKEKSYVVIHKELCLKSKAGLNFMFLVSFRRGVGIRIEEDLSGMERNFGDAVAKLVLGHVQLEMMDLLRLRPGMTIHLNRPAIMESYLEISDCEWARVRVSMDGDAIRLEVQEIITS